MIHSDAVLAASTGRQAGAALLGLGWTRLTDAWKVFAVNIIQQASVSPFHSGVLTLEFSGSR